MEIEAVKIKTFPLRMDEPFNKAVEEALKKSTIKSKHEYILKAVAEKVAREQAV